MSKHVYESFNLKTKLNSKNRISHILLIPINALLSPNTDCEFYNDIIDFFNQTLVGLSNIYTKSRILPYPVFLTLDEEAYEIYTLKYNLIKAKIEMQLSLTIHIIAHGEPTDFNIIDIGVDAISSSDFAHKIINILDEIDWGRKCITFHFHTCDSATTNKLTPESILEESFIGVFWNKLNKKGYTIEVIGYPGLYCSLHGSSGNAVIDIDGRCVEKSKAQVIIDENGNVKIPKLTFTKPKLTVLKSGNISYK